jgi:hypothetical protein
MSGKIYEAIPAIMAEIGPIGKNRENEGQHYKFRGIDDVYNAIHDLLIKYKVFTVPEVLEAKDDTVTTAKGNILFYARLLMRYTFFADDGSSIVAVTRGEGMDSGDKASNKAMAVAHKYAFIQIFAIPTQSGDDPENDSHEIKASKAAEEAKEHIRALRGAGAPKAPPPDDGTPPTERKNLESEIGRLSHLLSADSMSSARAQVEEWREQHKTGDIEPYLVKLRGLKKELDEKVLEKGLF